MTHNWDFTVGDLITLLEQFDPEAPVRLASQPSWPFEYRLAEDVVVVNGIVWLAEANQVGYLPAAVSAELGWRE